MTVQSNAHFGVQGQRMPEAIGEIKERLHTLDLDRYGVQSWRVEHGNDDTVQIILIMSSNDADIADADAERATEAVNRLLRQSAHRANWRERQRELILA